MVWGIVNTIQVNMHITFCLWEVHPNLLSTSKNTRTHTHTHTHTEHQMASRATAKLCSTFTCVVGCKEIGRGTSGGWAERKRIKKMQGLSTVKHHHDKEKKYQVKHTKVKLLPITFCSILIDERCCKKQDSSFWCMFFVVKIIYCWVMLQKWL